MPVFPGDEGYGEGGLGAAVRDEDPLRTKALAMLQTRGVNLESADQDSPEFREMLSEAIVEISGGLVKRAKKSEWGIDPWILDDLGLLDASEEEIGIAMRKIEEEEKLKQEDLKAERAERDRKAADRTDNADKT